MHKVVRNPEVSPAQSRKKCIIFLLLARESRLCFPHNLLPFARKEGKVDLQQEVPSIFFSVKDQIVNILGFGNHMAFLAATQCSQLECKSSHRL